jgi:hypothetical protein
VARVEVSAPNRGTVVETPQSRAGSIETKWSAIVSPGSAPSTWNGPVCGFRNGNRIFWETRSSASWINPVKQSSVQSSRIEPGCTFITGSAPPNVQT